MRSAMSMLRRMFVPVFFRCFLQLAFTMFQGTFREQVDRASIQAREMHPSTKSRISIQFRYALFAHYFRGGEIQRARRESSGEVLFQMRRGGGGFHDPVFVLHGCSGNYPR